MIYPHVGVTFIKHTSKPPDKMKACLGAGWEPLKFRLEKEATLHRQGTVIHLNIQQIFSDHVLHGKLSSCTRSPGVNETAIICALVEVGCSFSWVVREGQEPPGY